MIAPAWNRSCGVSWPVLEYAGSALAELHLHLLVDLLLPWYLRRCSSRFGISSGSRCIGRSRPRDNREATPHNRAGGDRPAAAKAGEWLGR
ncbi:MAG TPA: hypothetical protein VGD37_22305 [Kofleriaceae bacterium]|jgi:hypothetical protein